MSNSENKIKINMEALKVRREWKRHKIKDGHNIFRILPPFGEKSNNYPYRKWQIIWGLKDPNSGRLRPFPSSLSVSERCPVVEFVDKLKKKADLIKSNLQASGASEEAIKSRLSSLNKLISDLSPKTVYVYNAADKSGEVGLLELKSTAHKKMKKEMYAYIKDYNQDPTSLNSEPDDSGVWFDIIRTGSGRETDYDVKRVSIRTKDPQTGRISFEDDRTPLPESVVENYENLAYDLSSIYQVKTYEELSAILEANMSDIVEACPDAAFDEYVASGKSSINRSTSNTRTEALDDEDDQEEYTVKTPRTSNVKKPTSKITTRIDVDDDFEDDAMYASSDTTSSKVKLNLSSTLDDDFLAEADALLNS